VKLKPVRPETAENPPAFPSHGTMGEVAQQGMSLRDYFAGQALMGLSRVYALGEVDDYHPKYVAEDAYKLADEMLKARE
jgi:hypothetical protein